MFSLLNNKNYGQLEGECHEMELAERILDSNWCPAKFKDPKGRRHRDNFESIGLLVFDIDSHMTMQAATRLCQEQGWEHIIGTSKSHQIDKNGQPACDRFRIVIPLAEEILDEESYKSTWQFYADKYFPFADPQCKDVPRFYYPCKEIVAKGEGIEAEVQADYVQKIEPITHNQTGSEVKRKLYDSTWRFIHEGALPGSFHGAFVSSAQNIRDAGYTFDEALEKLNEAAEKSDGKALEPKYITQLEDFYSKPINEKYLTAPADEAPALPFATPSELLGDTISYLSDKEAMQGEPTCFPGLNKLLAGGLKKGELSVLCAESKSGKSTLFDQLIVHYLERDIPVGYASREMRPAQEVIPHMLNIATGKNVYKQEITQGVREELERITNNWKLYFSRGMGAFPKDEFEKWLRSLKELGVEYFFIDHFHYCLEDPMNQSELSLFIQLMKKLVNELDIHIFLIVQPNTSHLYSDDAVLRMKGGSVLDQTLDNLFHLKRLTGREEKHVNVLSLNKKRKLMVRTGKIYLKYNPETTTIDEVEWKEGLDDEGGERRNKFPNRFMTPRMPRIK